MSARRQYSPTCPAMPFWLWGRRVALAPLLFTIRNTKTSLTLSIPTIPQGTDGVPLTAASLTESLRPRRCQQRPLGSETGDTTPWLNLQLPSRCSAVNHATSCRNENPLQALRPGHCFSTPPDDFICSPSGDFVSLSFTLPMASPAHDVCC